MLLGTPNAFSPILRVIRRRQESPPKSIAPELQFKGGGHSVILDLSKGYDFARSKPGLYSEY